MNKDVYSRITDKIVADLAQGVRPWHQPWNAEHAAGKISRPLRHNGQPYSGINVIMLWAEAQEKAYSAPLWMTFRQAKALGGHVRKGERSTPVVYASTFHKREQDKQTGEVVEKDIPFLKQYAVFNVEQIDNLPAHYYAMAEGPALEPVQRIARAEAFLEQTGAQVAHGGNRAYYAAGADRIQLPPFEFFKDPESYYETRLHETVHWTRHPTRLQRDFGRKRWGDEGYAMEELVAEIGSAFLSADLDLTPEVRPDHAAYIGSWLTVLKNDQRAIFTAAAHAQRAADFLHGLQPQPAPEPQARQERQAGPAMPFPEPE